MPRQYQKSKGGLLETGLTRNQTPVSLMYPPEPNGRHASLETSLQYANPQQLVAAQHQQNVLAGYNQQPAQVQDLYYGYNPYGGGQGQGGNGNNQSQTNPQGATNQGQVTTTPSTTGGGHGPQGNIRGGAAPRPPLVFWYCCQCGWGPYQNHHVSCVSNADCGRPRCNECRVEDYYAKH